MKNLNEAIKFIKDKLDVMELDNTNWYSCSDLEHILELLLKTKQDFRDAQHKTYRMERGDEL
jgi:hypothetical protein